jgi:hypothetical protein
MDNIRHAMLLVLFSPSAVFKFNIGNPLKKKINGGDKFVILVF